MQLKIQRSQRNGAGLLSSSVIFCLDARAVFTPQEKQNISRYKLGGEVIYSSEAQQRAAQGGVAAVAAAGAQRIGVGSVDEFLATATGKIGHGLKAVALGTLSAIRLTITIGSLERGQHIECKSLDELLGAEDAIMTACQNLNSYLDAAATFDGREVVVDFSTGSPEIVAHATPPTMLVAPAPAGPVELRLPPPEDPAAPELHYAGGQAAGEVLGEKSFLQKIGIDFDTMDDATRKRVIIGTAIAVLLLILFACQHV